MLVSLKEVVFGYDDEIILHDISADLNDGDRIGLVGANGEGKSTLLNLITGSLETVSGEIFRKNGLSFGYLKQNAGLDSKLTVYGEMRGVFSHIFETEQRLRDTEHEMASLNPESMEFRIKSSEYNRLIAKFEANDGYSVDVRIKTVLNGMGFSNRYDDDISHMSGGEKTRLALCKLLLASPELLILDEPTNHLDFETLIWLEKYLEEYKGAIIVVSHDRYFLDKTVSRIWDIEDGRIVTYNGNYSKYKVLKKERVDRMLKEYEKQSKQIESMLDYARRNIARDSTSNSAKSRLHQLANMERLEKPRTFRKSPHFSFTFNSDPVKEVLKVNGLCLTVGEEKRVLVDDVTFTVNRGEKVAIIGANGTGKSTLIRRIVNSADSFGKIVLGKNVRVAYYDQENLNLDTEKRVIDELWFRYHKLSQTEIRKTLAQMLLFEDDIDKKVGMLSGGERAKLAFAVMLAEHGNVLILDEPTNHLDLPSREALEEGLSEFEGTVIFVSHDRYFLNAVADRIIEIDKGKLHFSEGGFDDYLNEKALAVQPKEVPPPKARTASFRSPKQRAIEANTKARIKQIEAELFELSARLDEINSLMCDPTVSADYIKMRELCDETDAIKDKEITLIAEWEQASERLAELEEQ